MQGSKQKGRQSKERVKNYDHAVEEEVEIDTRQIAVPSSNVSRVSYDSNAKNTNANPPAQCSDKTKEKGKPTSTMRGENKATGLTKSIDLGKPSAVRKTQTVQEEIDKLKVGNTELKSSIIAHKKNKEEVTGEIIKLKSLIENAEKAKELVILHSKA